MEEDLFLTFLILYLSKSIYFSNTKGFLNDRPL